MKQPVYLLAIAMALVALLPAVSSAEMVSAYFEGDPNEPTTVDTYPGVAGDGWSDGWKKRTDKLTSHTVVLGTTDPLASGTAGNYLSAYMDASAASGLLTVGREYNGTDLAGNPVIDKTKDLTITCLFRVDENLGEGSTFFTDTNDRYEIYDNYNSGIAKGVGTNATWIIGAYGGSMTAGDGVTTIPAGNWIFKDYSSGSNYQIDTGIALVTGDTYKFEITLHDSTKTWDGQVTNLDTTATSGKISGIGYRVASTSWGMPQFFGKASGSNDNREFSVDSLVVTQVPEPSMFIMALGAALAGLTIGRRRK